MPKENEFNRGYSYKKGPNEKEFLCDKLVIEAYNDDKLIGYIVNLKSEFNKEYFLNEKNNGKPFYANKFTVNEIEWILEIHPFRVDGFISLVLINVTSHECCYYDYKVNVTTNYMNERYVTQQLDENCSYWCIDEWMPLEVSNYNIDLVIKYEIEDNNLNANLFVCMPWNNCLVYNEFPQITITGNDFKLFGHEKILVRSSSVIKDLVHNNNVLNITNNNITKEGVNALLNILYSGRLYNSKDLVFKQLNILSEIYNIFLVKLLCDLHFSLNINKKNVVDKLLMSNQCKLCTCKYVCLKYIKKKYDKVIQSEKWKMLEGNEEYKAIIDSALNDPDMDSESEMYKYGSNSSDSEETENCDS